MAFTAKANKLVSNHQQILFNVIDDSYQDLPNALHWRIASVLMVNLRRCLCRVCSKLALGGST
eukprot:2014991-Amphidinium_carterae.1